jgi:DNA polymerase III alpha subunit (gram-positive type)
MYIFFDTETGGLNPDYSLLTVSAIAVDPNFDIVHVQDLKPGLYLRIKHEVYNTSVQALAINKINLADHDAIGFSVSESSEALEAFLAEAKKKLGVRRFIPAGHNVPFDISFLQHYLLPEKRWRAHFSIPPFDTCAIAKLFNSAGKINVGCGLEKLAAHFNFDMGRAHNAENDNLAAIHVAKKFVSAVLPISF